jgi:hypothetical protein
MYARITVSWIGPGRRRDARRYVSNRNKTGRRQASDVTNGSDSFPIKRQRLPNGSFRYSAKIMKEVSELPLAQEQLHVVPAGAESIAPHQVSPISVGAAVVMAHHDAGVVYAVPARQANARGCIAVGRRPNIAARSKERIESANCLQGSAPKREIGARELPRPNITAGAKAPWNRRRLNRQCQVHRVVKQDPPGRHTYRWIDKGVRHGRCKIACRITIVVCECDDVPATLAIASIHRIPDARHLFRDISDRERCEFCRAIENGLRVICGPVVHEDKFEIVCGRNLDDRLQAPGDLVRSILRADNERNGRPRRHGSPPAGPASPRRISTPSLSPPTRGRNMSF